MALWRGWPSEGAVRIRILAENKETPRESRDIGAGPGEMGMVVWAFEGVCCRRPVPDSPAMQGGRAAGPSVCGLFTLRLASGAVGAWHDCCVSVMPVCGLRWHSTCCPLCVREQFESHQVTKVFGACSSGSVVVWPLAPERFAVGSPGGASEAAGTG